MKKTKSLGVIEWPSMEVYSHSPFTHEITLQIKGNDKRVRVKTSVTTCVSTLVALAREVTGKQRQHAIWEWDEYKHLRDLSGYVPNIGEVDHE